MCGIVGFVAPQNEPSDQTTLCRMIRMIRHRGPDDVGTYVDRRVALGHARLSIIDIAGGRQPMSNEDSTLQIVFNGEIFNYLELRDELCNKGHRFATHSDTEVILHLFEEMGESCVSRLNGQWAFAIWDVRRQELFLSRDRMGVRPLFYTQLDGSFVFASEIKALFVYPGVRRELDYRALDQVFTFWHTLPPRTAFRQICELPPGHSATVRSGGVTLKQYWDISYPALPRTFRGDLYEEQEYAEELGTLLADASRVRLRSDVPVGAYLSGGLDSTIVAALVKRSGSGRLRTFSVRFDDSGLDEGAYQNEAVRFLGTEHSELRCSNDDIGNVFPDVIWHTEKPILRTAPAPLFLLSKLVRDSGYKVVLTGEGADEILGGYDIFKEVKVRSFLAAHPDSHWRPLLLKRLYPYLPPVQAQPVAYLRAFFHVGSDDLHDPYFSHLPRWRLTARLKGFFSRTVKDTLDHYDWGEDMLRLLPADYRGWDAFARAQYLEARQLLPGYILSSQGDRVAMAHSVEGRFPFLDYRVVEFASKLPPQLKMKVLTEKYLLRRCADGLVPEVVLRRHKQPYRAPDALSFVGPHSCEYAMELLSPLCIERYGVFNSVAVQKLVDKAKRGVLIGVGDNMAMVGILSTQLLLEKFIFHFSMEV